VDLTAVKEAPAGLLARGSVAAATNAVGLIEDAEVLFSAGRQARAYSLAVLAVEELGKAGSLTALAAMPDNLRAQAPLGRMLEWHQLKLVKGTLLAVAQVAPPEACATLSAMPISEMAEILDRAQALAGNEDMVRLRGLYVDVGQNGEVQQPSEVTAAQVREQLDLARLASSTASGMLDPGATARITHPDECTIEFSRALIGAFADIGYARSPAAAAEVWLDAASKSRG
jgi:AbiV family abortive infection protein